ncbi:MAG TPA: 3-phosphoshikimate 1-carboxyvinyltransferase [Candidatus Copromonas faecavium]|uniref:3-phosphoshikimate 1-carboxyvinyltransferase n=1 Tax=Candidatus Copromonas faecavium (nom. illeg.) TaxID=2840740 RepID=A0A9D1A3A5_9FIRM|nr:3-phosphoshikimate 1-carboxyvinyltransferase [Candidatus Copromonas faecavium]
MKLQPAAHIRGEVTVPGDKSISHRAVMFGAISDGRTEIQNFLEGADCLSTISCFRSMGIEIEKKQNQILVHGKGLRGLTAPSGILDCGNSGTTTRLISGILSPQPFTSTLTGDDSIKKRPMNRIIEPLTMMGADIKSLNGNGCAPLQICGRPLHGIHYHSKVASAQVKSAILLAGLYAEGETRVTEPKLSRNHTELMLKRFGADVRTEGTTAVIRPAGHLTGTNILVPGDISSAVYFVAAALILPNSEVLIKNVGINPTRAGLLTVCKNMGAQISLVNESHEGSEPTADLLVHSSNLKGTVIEGDLIPAMIDELPTVALMACFAEGTTVIRDAAELKVKESNRIAIMVENLSAMGADIVETEDGMIIHGGKPLHGAVIDSHKDHRIAMTFAVAALAAGGETEILDADCVSISYPRFYDELNRLTR